MIHIDQDQTISENSNLRVMTPTGDYEDSTLIEFYDVSAPAIVSGAFQAQYVKYGNMVYTFNDPIELGKEILKIDPTSTHTAASYVRMTEELLVKMNNGSLEPSSLDQVLSVEQDTMKDQMSDYSKEADSQQQSEEPGQFVGQEGPLMDNPTHTPDVVEETVPVIDSPSSSVPPSEEISSEGLVSILNKKGKRNFV
jgi:hypothetical protein